MGAGALNITTRSVDEIDREIANALNALPRLRAERKVAQANERKARLSAVERDYRAGVDLEIIRETHSVSAGQIAGWAHRNGWTRPAARVEALSPHQQTIYRDLRGDRTKAAAVRIASEATAIAGPAHATWGGRRGCGAQSARLSGAPTQDRSPVRNQPPDRHARRVTALGSSAGERAPATNPLNSSARRHRPEVGPG